MYENYYNPQQTPFNGGYYGGGFGAPGYQYPQRAMPKSTQPLTQEQQSILQNRFSQEDFTISQEEIWAGICTHKNKANGISTLTQCGNDSDPDHVKCAICGAEFSLRSYDQLTVESKVQEFIDMLQTIKTVYGDIPEQLAANFFQILPLCSKVPKLWKQSMTNLKQYENYNGSPMQVMYGAPNAFNTLNNMVSGPIGSYATPYQQPGMMGGMYPQQPMMQPQQGMPMAYPQMQPQPQMQYPQMQPQQPMMYPQQGMPMAYPQQAVQNPFGMGAPVMGQAPNMMGQMPQAPQAGVQPQAPAAPTQPAAAQNTDVTQNKQFNV